MNINWTAIVMISMWISAAIGSAFTKDTDPFVSAVIGTAVLGFGYLMINY